MAVFIPIPSARVTTARKVNAGDLRSWRMAKRRSIMAIFDFGFSIFDWKKSFGVKGDNGIDGAGPPGGQPARNKGDEHERHREKEKGDWIARADPVKERRDQSR